MSGAIPTELANLVHSAEEALNIATLTRYISIVGFVAVFYDWILSLEKEFRLIWPARLSLVKALYIFVRVSTLVGLGIANYHLAGFRAPLTHTFCQVWGATGALIEVFSTAASNWLMMLRVCALYGGKRKVVIAMYALFIASYVACFVLVGLSLDPILSTMEYSPIANMCVSSTKNVYFVFIFGAPFVLEAVIFFMTIFKVLEQLRLVNGDHGKFLHIIQRDGLAFYALMFIVRVWNIYTYAALPVNYLYMSIYTLWAVVSVLTLRMLLNLRNVANPREWEAEMDIANHANPLPPTPITESKRRAHPTLSITVVTEQARYSDEDFEMNERGTRNIRASPYSSPVPSIQKSSETHAF